MPPGVTPWIVALRDRDLVPAKKKKINRSRIIFAVVFGVVTALLFRFGAHRYWKYPAVVSNDEMSPAISKGAVVYVRKRFKPGDLKRGAIVLMRHPINHETLLFRRIVGISGDVVQLLNRRVLVNGARLNEDWEERVQAQPIDIPSLPAEISRRDNTEPVYIKADQIFVLADNRLPTLDSRSFGTVPVSAVEGIVQLRD
ncbi:MAG: signal peptidase I [Spirochaetia bacterium]|nr:signal peptidase I [Spirochaetia bacterium]